MTGRPHLARATAAALALVAALAACDSLLDPDEDRSGACPQTYEFGNYGCGRVVVLLDASGVQPPTPYLLHAGAYSLSTDPIATDLAAYDRAGSARRDAALDEPVVLQMTFWTQVPGDTVPARVFARVMEDWRGTAVVGGTQPALLAVDSAAYTFRRTPVGQVPPVDTVRLTLRTP